MSMDLSVEAKEPAARLQDLKATTTKLKRSPTAGLQHLMQTRLMPYLPLWVCREMVHGALATHTVVSFCCLGGEGYFLSYWRQGVPRKGSCW